MTMLSCIAESEIKVKHTYIYSSPLEALVVVVITGTDRTVISYININSLLILKLKSHGMGNSIINCADVSLPQLVTMASDRAMWRAKVASLS